MQAVPGHGGGGGVSRRKGQVWAETKSKKIVPLKNPHLFGIYFIGNL